jgi:hypothetical protein
MTIFGVEIFGLSWSGYSELVFAGLESRPHVELAGDPGGGRHRAASRRRRTVVGGTHRQGLRFVAE